jgi:tetratricopeptide (TPR) repeat protein
MSIASRSAAIALAVLASPLAHAATDASAPIDALWDFESPATSETRFRAEIARHPAGSLAALEATTQLARAEGLQRRFAEADATLDAVAQQLERHPARLRVRYLLERGRVRNSSGAPADAVPLFQQALAAAERDTAPGAAFYRIDALHMLGIAAPPGERLDWDRKALAAAEAASDPRAQGWRGSLLNNLGWAEHERGRYEAALGYWQRALALLEAAGDVPRTRIAKWTVARGLRSLNRYAEAETIQLALAAETKQPKPDDGYIYEELAELALARGDAAAAARRAREAHALLAQDADFVANEPARLARLATLAGTAATPR